MITSPIKTLLNPLLSNYSYPEFCSGWSQKDRGTCSSSNVCEESPRLFRQCFVSRLPHEPLPFQDSEHCCWGPSSPLPKVAAHNQNKMFLKVNRTNTEAWTGRNPITWEAEAGDFEYKQVCYTVKLCLKKKNLFIKDILSNQTNVYSLLYGKQTQSITIYLFMNFK